MKLNKKTIIILIVVAVVGYFLWKRYKTASEVSADGGSTSGGNTVSYDPSNLEDVIAAAKINTTLANYVRQQAAVYENYETGRTRIEDKAREKNRTYPQQLVIEMMYGKYYAEDENGVWKPKSEADKKAFDAIVARIDAM